MRTRFDRNAVASSDGAHVHVSHDRRANTTGRTPYTFCGSPVIILIDGVYKDGRRIGHLYVDEKGGKWVYGPKHKGQILTT